MRARGAAVSDGSGLPEAVWVMKVEADGDVYKDTVRKVQRLDRFGGVGLHVGPKYGII